MKTTVEIPDGLLDEARQTAQQEGTSIGAIVEEGLRAVLAMRKRRSAFSLRKATFQGRGLQAPLTEASWERICDRVYETRGT